MTSPRWRIIVPLKASARGKSRIDVPASDRRDLALAMAQDTVDAARGCGTVLAVVEDPVDGAALADLSGVTVHVTQVRGLNESILDGLGVLLGADKRAPVAVLPGDLPALRTEELSEALRLSAAHRFAVVADHEGIGTTLLAAFDPTSLTPAYGTDSYHRHLRAGAVPIELPPTSGLRMDVDTAADLSGTPGPRTRDVLRRMALVGEPD
ncbi:2-phospho-L-lactate guanylyltransferase [Nakamurella panacisegetis]|uniref:2-phospho-L-lactate guanylyltransferase n=1 Tax=Nakamurella panacisegetis TaxID=1090615 RepID=A0A1H0QL69_9ACTN|nr:2-phospho-L-lactate guanylyltransferase [Nakamurella panacisegetis]SDP17486.1 2-phospho-L-lactate guanylyltransferase [Nakamurella panacisegetis]